MFNLSKTLLITLCNHDVVLRNVELLGYREFYFSIQQGLPVITGMTIDREIEECDPSIFEDYIILHFLNELITIYNNIVEAHNQEFIPTLNY